MAKIVFHIQTLTAIDREANARNMAIMFHLGRHTKHEFLLSTPFRSSIDRGRNEAAKLAMDAECEYVFFLDDDMVIDPRTLDSLIVADRDIVMAHSYIRGYPYRPMCFKWKEKDAEVPSLEYFETDEELESLKDANGIVGEKHIAAVGFTCTLIKTSLLLKLNPPFFITNPHGMGTEDVYFCMRAKAEVGKDVSIAVDMKYPTTHLGERESISAHTVKDLRIFHETTNPDIIKLKKEGTREGDCGDRAEDYNKKCLEA